MVKHIILVFEIVFICCMLLISAYMLYKRRKNVMISWDCPYEKNVRFISNDPKWIAHIKEEHMNSHRPCKNGNSNICVVEGCHDIMNDGYAKACDIMNWDKAH